VPDSLWERVQPLLPGRRPRRRLYPGRKPCDDRAALAGIVFVLKTGIGWNQLPRMLFGCSGTTCWRRLQLWTEAGVWPGLHELVLVELRASGQLDWRSRMRRRAALRAGDGAARADPRAAAAAHPSLDRGADPPLTRADPPRGAATARSLGDGLWSCGPRPAVARRRPGAAPRLSPHHRTPVHTIPTSGSCYARPDHAARRDLCRDGRPVLGSSPGEIPCTPPQLRPGGVELGLHPLGVSLLVAHQPAEREAVAALGGSGRTQPAQQTAGDDGVLVLTEQVLDGLDLLDQPLRLPPASAVGRPAARRSRRAARGSGRRPRPHPHSGG